MIAYNLSSHNTSNMEKLEYEDGTLPKHVEAFLRRKLTTKEVLEMLDRENVWEFEPGQNLWVNPYTTSSDQ